MLYFAVFLESFALIIFSPFSLLRQIGSSAHERVGIAEITREIHLHRMEVPQQEHDSAKQCVISGG